MTEPVTVADSECDTRLKSGLRTSGYVPADARSVDATVLAPRPRERVRLLVMHLEFSFQEEGVLEVYSQPESERYSESRILNRTDTLHFPGTEKVLEVGAILPG